MQITVTLGVTKKASVKNKGGGEIRFHLLETFLLKSETAHSLPTWKTSPGGNTGSKNSLIPYDGAVK
jgi:hypothetical protein